MNSFTLLLVCVQALLIQNVLSCPCAGPAPYSCGASAPAPLPCGGTTGSYQYSNSLTPAHGPYGIRAESSNLVIDGTAQVWGDMPFASSVSLNGDVPSEGTASLRNACNCGDSYLH